MLKVLSIFLRVFWAFISVAIVILTPSEKDDEDDDVGALGIKRRHNPFLGFQGFRGFGE